ncbi:periplasmic protein [Planctomycetes bacterium MalM25]|nr:periplasmic protein [Planctomycetes bacterium MalM25]
MRHWIVAAAAAALLWPASAGAATPTADEMAGQVAQTLRESGQLKNYRVGVKYEDGVAWLMGSVTSPEQSETAAKLAGTVEGIQHVINKLEVVAPKQTATPAEKKTELKQDLLLTMLEESASPKAAPAPLPPNPRAMPAPAQAGSRGMPMPLRRTAGVQANMPQGRNPMAQGRAPMPRGQVQAAQYGAQYAGGGAPMGQSTAGARGVSYNGANMPNYAWPSYAAHPNYAAVSYPKQYSPSAWPYIGPFYPYPQVPLGWRKVTLEWDDGWWFLDFSHQESH